MHHAARRIIDLTEAEFDSKLAQLAQALEPTGREGPDPDRALTRKDAAAFLAVSLTTLDLLSRRARDPLPYYVVGESRRYARRDLLAWLRRQTEVAA